MTVGEMEKRKDVAEWYVINVLHKDIEQEGLESLVEWFVKNLREAAYQQIENDCELQMSNLEAEGFFK